MTNNKNILKRLVLAFLAMALISVPGAALAAMPDPIKKKCWKRGRRSILNAASGAMAWKVAVTALPQNAFTLDRETLFKEHSKSDGLIRVSCPWTLTSSTRSKMDFKALQCPLGVNFYLRMKSLRLFNS